MTTRLHPRALSLLLVSLTLLDGCRSAASRERAYMASGQTYQRQGKPREAAIEYANAVRLMPGDVEAHRALAGAYRQSGATDLAIYELGKMLQINPEDLNARIDVGRLLVKAGQFQSALVQARWMAKKEPRNAAVQELLTTAAGPLGNREEALKAARTAVVLAPGNAEYHTNLGGMLLAYPELRDQATTELVEAIRLNPKDVQAHIYIAQLQESTGNVGAAEQELKRAIQDEPESLQARTSLAALYARAGNRVAAEETLRKASDECSNNPDAALLLERFYEQTGQTDRARDAYAFLATKHPNSLSLQVAYLRVLMNSGEYDSVRSRLDPLIQDHDSDPDVALFQGYMLLHDGKNSDAVDLLKKASQNEPNRSDVLMLLSDALERAGQVQDALSTLRRALQIDPSSVNGLTGLANFGYRNRNSAAITEAATQMLLFHPQAAEGYLWRGLAGLQKGRGQQALTDLQESLKRAPNETFTMVQIGLALQKTGDTKRAKEMFEHVLQKTPDPIAVSALADQQIQAGRAADAVSMIQQQITRSPLSAQLYRVLAQAQMAAGDANNAQTSAKRGLSLAPTDRSMLQVFSEAALAAGHIDEPLARWQQWMTDHPDDPHGPAALGALYESAGEDKRAMDFYRRSLSLQGDQPEISAAIAMLSAETGGNLDVAFSMAQSAYQAAPDSAQAADAVGWINYRKGLPASALAPLRMATDLDGTNATVLYHLGTVEADLGDQARALGDLQKAHSLATGTRLDDDIQKKIAKLQSHGG